MYYARLLYNHNGRMSVKLTVSDHLAFGYYIVLMFCLNVYHSFDLKTYFPVAVKTGLNA